jgi:hypothetical protein
MDDGERIFQTGATGCWSIVRKSHKRLFIDNMANHKVLSSEWHSRWSPKSYYLSAYNVEVCCESQIIVTEREKRVGGGGNVRGKSRRPRGTQNTRRNIKSSRRILLFVVLPTGVGYFLIKITQQSNIL